jgi:uncharacterized protein (TIGR02145 family)
MPADMKKFYFLLIALLSCMVMFAQKKGTFTDTRDGKTYPTVTFGTQTWIAGNLNFNIKGSWCFRDDSSYCLKYGKLYNFGAANAACPSGWHLPSVSEWDSLIIANGGPDEAGLNLSLWRPNIGFNLMYGGRRHPAGEYYYLDMFGFYWTSSISDKDNSFAYVTNPASGNIKVNPYDKWQGYSVRCVKDP